MAFTPRTDMASEFIDAGAGIEQSEKVLDGIRIEHIEIRTEEAAQRIKRQIGTYITIHFEDAFSQTELFDNAIKHTAQAIRTLCNTDEKTVLVACLGNRHLTSDALGPMISDRLIVTRHLKEAAPQFLKELALGNVAQVIPDVLGRTGIESAEAVLNAVRTVKPDVVFAIDALAAREMKRLCACVQLSDAGICPGAGVGNNRMGLNSQTLGVPVIAIGVPTVMDALTLAADIFQKQPDEKTVSAYDKHLAVAPKDIDILVKNCAELISSALNKAFHKDITANEMKLLTQM